MTRSVLSPRGPEVAKKTFRANAKAQGLTFREAAEARNSLPKQKDPIAPGMGRRVHGNFSGKTHWNGRVLVNIGHESEDMCEVEEPDYGTWYDHHPHVRGDNGQAPPAPVLGSLLDIAKPAKAKGERVAKDFEVVEAVSKTIAIGDEEWQDGGDGVWETDFIDWAEWGEAFEEFRIRPQMASYSAIVEGKDVVS